MNPSATPRGGCCLAAWSNKALLQPRAVLFQRSVIDYQVMWMKAMMNYDAHAVLMSMTARNPD